MNTFRMSLISLGAMLAVPGPLVISGRAAAATEKPTPLPDAGVRTRRNPFLPNTEIQRLLDSIRPAPGAPLVVAPPLEVYPELRGPRRSGATPLEDGAGPAVPSMRVVGF